MSVSSVSTGSAGQLWGKVSCPQHRTVLGPDSHRRQGTGQESGLQQGRVQLGCRVAATLLTLLSLWTRPSFCDLGARTADSAARSLFSVFDGAQGWRGTTLQGPSLCLQRIQLTSGRSVGRDSGTGLHMLLQKPPPHCIFSPNFTPQVREASHKYYGFFKNLNICPSSMVIHRTCHQFHLDEKNLKALFALVIY